MAILNSSGTEYLCDFNGKNQDKIIKYGKRGINFMNTKKAAIAATAIFLAETGLIFYYGRVSVSDNLAAEYNLAEPQMAMVDTEIDRINLQANEHQYPVEVLSAILSAKPEDCSFKKITIGDYLNGDWIQLSIQSSNPASIQSYTDSIQANDFFKNISLNNLKAGAGIATADIVIRKAVQNGNE